MTPVSLRVNPVLCTPGAGPGRGAAVAPQSGLGRLPGPVAVPAAAPAGPPQAAGARRPAPAGLPAGGVADRGSPRDGRQAQVSAGQPAGRWGVTVWGAFGTWRSSDVVFGVDFVTCFFFFCILFCGAGFRYL